MNYDKAMLDADLDQAFSELQAEGFFDRMNQIAFPSQEIKVASYKPTRLSLDQIAQAFNKNKPKPKKD